LEFLGSKISRTRLDRAPPVLVPPAGYLVVAEELQNLKESRIPGPSD